MAVATNSDAHLLHACLPSWPSKPEAARTFPNYPPIEPILQNRGRVHGAKPPTASMLKIAKESVYWLIFHPRAW